jgi:hypothetical protein
MSTTTNSTQLRLWFCLLAGLGVAAGAAEGTKMDDKLRQKIAETAGAQQGWKVEDVRVDEVERLRRPSCSFYTVGHKVRPIAHLANYAVLGGQQVIGAGDGSVAAKILDACGDGAPPDWWAEIVTRFHGDLGGGLVLRDEKTRPDVVRKMIDAGEAFAPPVLDKERQSLTFLLLNPETNVLYRIQATRIGSGPVDVVKTKVRLTALSRAPGQAV